MDPDKIRTPKRWKDFAIMPGEILEDPKLGAHAKMVVAAIMYHAWDGGEAWPGKKLLARLCSCSERAIFNAIRQLEKEKYLLVRRENGRSNVYQFISKKTQAPHAGGAGTTCRGPRHHMPGSQAPHAYELKSVTRDKRNNERAGITRQVGEILKDILKGDL